MTLPLTIILPENDYDLKNTLTDMYKDIANAVNGDQGSWTPTIEGSTTAGTGTYTEQSGIYYRQGLIVDCWFTVTTTDHTGAGDLRIKLPQKFKKYIDIWVGEVIDSEMTYPSGTNIVLEGVNDTYYANCIACGDGIAAAVVQLDVNAAITVVGHIRYIGIA